MISRRDLIGGLAGAVFWPRRSGPVVAAADSEVLYNGIRLGAPWPPRRRYPDVFPVIPPYLADPPAVIPIDVGRQLFVDDFLIAETNLTRTFHHATYHSASPILRPDQPWEMRDGMAERTNKPSSPSAMVFSDGVFFDPQRREFLMWYMGGYGMATCLATSDDGIAWRKPRFDVVPGTNIVHTWFRDSATVWLDWFASDVRERYKMAIFVDHGLVLWVSPDGVHWSRTGETGRSGDRSTFFYNAFRRQWVFSLRATEHESSIGGRYRQYWEAPAFEAAVDWSGRPAVPWVKADALDVSLSPQSELYNLDCVAYESVLLGLFSMWRGETTDREKINEIVLGFSRDGFHWHRPDRRAFLTVSNTRGAWNWANVQSAGGGCVVVGDQLYFYVSGRQGRPGTDAPGVCSTGLAILRRDGFVSMDWRPDEAPVVRLTDGMAAGGMLTTRPVRFSGGHLFVNADTRGGELRVEVLDQRGQVIAPFTRDACAPVAADGARLAVRWASGSLAHVAGQPVRFRFSMTGGRLYAFWVSASAGGESGGYPAAGGPEFSGPVDTSRGR